MVSARYFPGAITVAIACDASIFAFKNGSSGDLTSIPYVMDIIMAPGVLWKLGDGYDGELGEEGGIRLTNPILL